MRILPFTLLKPRGIGTPGSIVSRAGEILEQSIRACESHVDFKLSIDTVWAIGRRRASLDRVSSLCSAGRLAIGSLWAGVDPVRYPEAFLRDVQLGALSLDLAGIDSSTIVIDGDGGPSSGLLDWAGICRVIFATRGSGCVDLSCDLGLRFLSDAALAHRDAEREISSTEDVIGLGGALWCPTLDTIRTLIERAEDAGWEVRFSSWDALPAGVPSGRGQAKRRYFDAIQPDVSSVLRRVTQSLLRTDRIVSLGSLLGMDVSSWNTEDVWRRHLEDLAGSYTGSGDRAKQSELHRSCAEIAGWSERAQADVELRVAEEVDAGKGPDGILPLVVFNPSTHQRSDIVETDVIYYGDSLATDFGRYEFYRIVDPQGNPVGVEEISGKQVETAEVRIRFVAEDVPALGYKTYYLVPKPQDVQSQAVSIQAPGAMVPDFPEPTFALEDVEERISEPRRGLRLGRKFHIGEFTIDVDEVTGSIDILGSDGQKLLEGMRVEAEEDSLSTEYGGFDPTGRAIPLVVQGVDLVESGEVSARIRVSGQIGKSPAQIDLCAYAGLPYLDFEVALSWRDSNPAMVVLRAGLGCLGAGRFGAAFSSAESYEAGYASWMISERESLALTLAAESTAIACADGELRSPLLLSTADPASYAYNRIWMPYPEDVTYAFRLGLVEKERATQVVDRSGFLSCRAIYDRISARRRPASDSGLEIGSDSVSVTSVRSTSRGIECVLHNPSGSPGEARLSHAGKEQMYVDVVGNRVEDADDLVQLDAGQVKAVMITSRSPDEERNG
ncbi:MAG: hypothetical protein CME21_09920 [Gemmatimonadetes bacterium]|nr:hypothetical protein [Gemmatimonadota bacterium]